MKKIVIAGGTGMTGQIVLDHCIADAKIDEIICLVRKERKTSNPKVVNVVVHDFLDYSALSSLFEGVSAIYYCVGVYTGAVDRDAFRKITITYPMTLAKAVKEVSPNVAFVLLSGQGADRNEKSKLMFALDKGKVENQLEQLFGELFFSCRPGYIYPVSPRKEPNWTYALSRKIYPILQLFGEKYSIKSTELGKAMYLIGQNLPAQKCFKNEDLLHYLKRFK